MSGASRFSLARRLRAGETVYAVRDWILVQWNDRWRWPNFNIADALLVVGAGVLLAGTFIWRALAVLRGPFWQDAGLTAG